MAVSEGHEPGQGVLRAAFDACRGHLGFVLLFSAALNLLYLAPSLYMLQVYDRVLTSGGVLTLIFLTLILVLCLATLAFLDAIRARILATASRRLDRLIAPELLAAVMQREVRAAAGPAQPLREFDTLRMALSGAPALAVIDLPWTPIYIAVCFMIHPWLGALAIIGGALLLGIAAFNEIATRRALRTYEESSASMYALQHNDGVYSETVRALGMQDALVHRQLAARESMAMAQGQATQVGAGFLAGTKFTRLLLQSLALGLGAYLAVQQEITAGGVIAGSILATRAFAPLEQIVAAWRQYGQGARALRILQAVFAARGEAKSYTELPPPRGDLALEQATVRSPSGDRFLLQAISFRVAAGEIVGVIGPSGAGKTTLMRIISGAVPPDGGAVRLDGAKLSDWAPERLGAHIGYLPQDVSLFAGTIADNIARFQREVGAKVDHAVIRAAEAAGVHEVVLSLPRGYDTEIGPGGRGLSAGQAQRIGLARALYGDPMLIVLDEPNSHLDSDGETALIGALKSAQARGATCIVVAHRAGFLGVADKLLLLRDGRLDLYGPREQVLAKLSGGGSRQEVAQSEPAGVRE